MGGMDGVLHNAGDFAGEGRGTQLILAAVFTVRYMVCSTAVPISDSDAADQHTLIRMW